MAVAAACAVSGSALAFEIETGNEDLVLRWDNTFRYNIGMRAQEQDPAILKNPNLDDGDRNFSKNSLVTNRLDVLSEFDLIWQKNYGIRVSAAGWYDAAYGSLDNTNTATANTLVNGLPVAGELSPYTKRYAKGVSGEWLDAFVFANFDVAGMPVNVKAGQHTVYWGDSLLLGGAVHGISYAQNSLDVWKGFSTPGTEAKELFRPRGGLTSRRSRPRSLSIAGQWFYNWQAVRLMESGSYLTFNDAALFGGDSAIVGANPFAASVPVRRRCCARGTRARSRLALQRQPRRLGPFGALEPGVARRHAGLLRPQRDRLPAAAVPDAGSRRVSGGDLHGDRRHRRWPGPASSTRTRPTSPTYAEGQVRHLRLRLRQQHPHLRRHAVEGGRRHVDGRRDLVPAEHAARERAGEVLPAPLVNPCHGADRAPPAADERRRAGRARQHDARPRQLHQHHSQDGAVRHRLAGGELTFMRWLSVTQNEAVFKGRAGYSTPALGTIDAVTKNYAASASTSRRRGSRSCRAST